VPPSGVPVDSGPAGAVVRTRPFRCPEFPFVHDACPASVENLPMSTWDDVVAIAARLPEVEESTWFSTPSLKVRGKGFARLRTEARDEPDPPRLVLICDLDEKAALLASGDAAFSTTPHYDGYGAILVDLAKVEQAHLAELIEQAWRRKAPARLRKAFDAQRGLHG